MIGLFVPIVNGRRRYCTLRMSIPLPINQPLRNTERNIYDYFSLEDKFLFFSILDNNNLDMAKDDLIT